MAAHRSVLIVALCVATSGIDAMAAEGQKSKTSKEQHARTFLFTYAFTVDGLPRDRTARVWMPVPPANEDQDVKIVGKSLPGEDHIGTELKYGNQIMYVEAMPDAQGALSVEVTYEITRREVRGDFEKQANATEGFDKFLQPDAKVPITGKPLALIKGKTLPMNQVELARLLYDTVNAHMRYSKVGTGWGQGDAVWACDSGYGNCTDFHSLFISLARSQKIPAKFEIGFPLPEARGQGEIPGYHCWAKFRPTGKDWVPVDISEANKHPNMREYYFGNLTADRVAFSNGRDLTLEPKQDGKPLNFFVYPFVEVDGKPHAPDKIRKRFTYKDVAINDK
jgi:transglutaminase-like putative cysteine protease